MTQTKANDHFGSHNGSENFYCHRPSLILYSDGIKELAEACQSFWLIDLIISHQSKKDINLQRFQVWELLKVRDSCFDIMATDGNKRFIVSQQIPYSDFPYDEAIVWLVDGTLMLPCEY